MKPVALAVALGLAWGAVSLLVGLLNLVWPDYGVAFLDVMASVYHGYDGHPSAGQVLILTGYSLVDGAILGYVVGWMYVRASGAHRTT